MTNFYVHQRPIHVMYGFSSEAEHTTHETVLLLTTFVGTVKTEHGRREITYGTFVEVRKTMFSKSYEMKKQTDDIGIFLATCQPENRK